MAGQKNSSMINIVGYIIIFLLVLFSFYVYSNGKKEIEDMQKEPEVNAKTDKYVYSKESSMVVNIDNEKDQPICFSSCYPYMFQYIENGWKFYSYAACPEDNTVGLCISPHEMKSFEIDLKETGVLSAKHRLAIYACTGCNVGDSFSVDELIYSNNFIIDGE